jgi:hypothetical protein
MGDTARMLRKTVLLGAVTQGNRFVADLMMLAVETWFE